MMIKKYPFIRVAPLFCAGTIAFCAAAPRMVWAQDTTAPTNIAPLPTASDLFAGRDTPGPYALTWKKLPPPEMFAPVVVLDGKMLTPDAYTWDAEHGTITFAKVIKSASMAHITFPYDPASSERSAAPASAPVTVPLLRAGGAQLQLTALSGVRDAKKGGDDTLLVWRLSGAPMNVLGGRITTQALLAPDLRADDKGETAGLWERTGLNIGYLVGNETSGVEAKFSRGGKAFAGVAGKSFQMNDTAQESRFLAARYALAPWLRAEWKQNDTQFLTGQTTDSVQQTLSVRLGGAGNQPVLNFARVEDDRTDSKGVASGKISDKLELQAKIGTVLALSGTAQSVEKATGDKPGEKTTDLALSLKAQSSDKTQAANVAVTGASRETATVTEARSGVSVTLQPSPSVTLIAEQSQQSVLTTPKDGAAQTTQKEQVAAQAKIALAPGTSLAGGVVRDTASSLDKTSDVQATTLTAKMGEGKGIEIAQSVVSRAGTAPGTATLDSTDTRLSLRPMRGLTLTGALLNNPQKDGRITESIRQEMGLQAKMGAMELGGGYALTELAESEGLQTGEFSVSLGVRFNRYTRLSGEYTDGLFWGDVEGVQTATRGLRVFSLGLTHDLGAAFNFSFGGKMAQNKTAGAEPNDYNAEAKIGIKF